MPSAPVRFIAFIDAKPRCVLSARELKSGDLLLDLRAKQVAREPGVVMESRSADPNHGQDIIESRYSVHMSPKSTVANVIKLTHTLGNDTEITAVNYSSGIKHTNNFTPIYSRRCSDLRHASYDVDEVTKQDVVLGNWTLNAFTLVFAVFVGPSNRKFACPPHDDFQFQQVNFTEFSLVLLWSFLSIAGHVSQFFTHLGTRPDIGPTSAVSDAACITIFDRMRLNIKAEFVQTLGSEPQFASLMPLAHAAIYFSEPRVNTREYILWSQALIARGVIKQPK
jgi:hypothetical protein